MAQIDALIPAQRSRIPEVVEQWRGMGLSTAPTDRSAAEAAIRRCYECAGIKPPEQFIWLKSPLAGALAYIHLRHPNVRVQATVVGDNPYSARDSVSVRVEPSWLRRHVEEILRTSVGTSVGDSIWTRVLDNIQESEWIYTWAEVEEFVATTILSSVEASVRDSFWASVGDGIIASASVWESVVYGSHEEAGMLSPYSYFLEICGLGGCERLDGWFEQAKHCGWWWPFENLVIATEKPVALHLDERERLHHATEPAIAYGDGWGVYAWHGMRIPPRYYEQPVTAQQILEERNAEVRRALIERYGQERFFLDADATVLDRDPEHGAELIAVDLPRDPEQRMVALKLRCPSTAAVYIVRVPPDQTKARAALAWSFGLQDASKYVLAGES